MSHTKDKFDKYQQLPDVPDFSDYGKASRDNVAEKKEDDPHSTYERHTSQDLALLTLLFSVLAPYKKFVFLAIVLMLVISGLNVLPPYLLQIAIDGPIAERNLAGLWPIAIIYGASVLLMFAVMYIYTICIQYAGQRALADLRVKLFGHILKQDQGFFGRQPVGDLVSRMTSDIDTLNALLSSSMVTVLIESVTLIAIIVVMFVLNWQLALLSISVLPILALVTVYFRRRIRDSSIGERSAMARISSFLNEQSNGMTIVQLFGRQRESDDEFQGYNRQYRESIVNLRWQSALFLSVLEILAAVGLALVLYGGGQGVLAGWATLGMLVAFVQYTQRAFRPILTLSMQYNAVQIALGAAERVKVMLDTEPEIRDKEDAVSVSKISGNIELKDVHFRYLPDEPVLRGVSLQIPAGQTVAIVGATGAGKSSLVSLLARSYDPQEGSILLDDIDLRDMRLEDLRRLVAVVPQDPICVEGSVTHNIRLYRDDISDEAVRHAAELTNAAKFIEKLPDQYDYKIRSGGANLSQGQRQLLALARAIALSPEGVLVLDEATSSIDTATEALIQEALERVLRMRTSIVIAHRLSTIRNADRIIVMERGKIIEDGNHYSLLEQGGHYARLHEHQLATASTP